MSVFRHFARQISVAVRRIIGDDPGIGGRMICLVAIGMADHDRRGPGVGHRPGDLPDDLARGPVESQQLRLLRVRADP